MSDFKLRPSPFTEAELIGMDCKRERIEQDNRDRDARISQFDTVPTYSKLELYRGKYRISQAKMAALMGVSKRSYCDYEAGETPIPFKALRKLAEATDLDFNEFIVGDVNRADKNHSIDIIRQTRKIVAYCLKNNAQLTHGQAFAVAERFVIEYGVQNNLLIDEPDKKRPNNPVKVNHQIDDCIRTVTYGPEAEGLFDALAAPLER